MLLASHLYRTSSLRDRCLDELYEKDSLSPGKDTAARYYEKLAADPRNSAEPDDFLAAYRSCAYTAGDDEAMLDKLCDVFLNAYKSRSGVENPGSLDEEIALPIVRQIKFGAEA